MRMLAARVSPAAARLNSSYLLTGATRMATVAGHLGDVAGGFTIRAAIVAIVCGGTATHVVLTGLLLVCHLNFLLQRSSVPLAVQVSKFQTRTLRASTP